MIFSLICFKTAGISTPSYSINTICLSVSYINCSSIPGPKEWENINVMVLVTIVRVRDAPGNNPMWSQGGV